MATGFKVKISKMANSPPFVALAFQSGLQYHNFDFKMFTCNYFSTLFVRLVRFGFPTPEFKGVKCVHSGFFLKIKVWDKLSQDPFDRFSPSFHWIVGIWSQSKDLTFFFRSIHFYSVLLMMALRYVMYFRLCETYVQFQKWRFSKSVSSAIFN